MQGAPSLDETVRAVVARQLSVAPDALTADAELSTLGLDPTVEPSLLGAVGDELDVRFPDDFLDGVTTYSEFTSAVRLAVGA